LHLQVQILIVFKLCGNLVQFLAKNNLLLDEQVTSWNFIYLLTYLVREARRYENIM
jgi:hypothetical protein